MPTKEKWAAMTPEQKAKATTHHRKYATEHKKEVAARDKAYQATSRGKEINRQKALTRRYGIEIDYLLGGAP